MPKPTFKPCGQHQLTLLPTDLSDLIEPDCMVRVVDAVIDSIDVSELYALYPGGGASAYDPKMMLKVVVFAYASGIYSSRKIERATRENIHFMWLCGMAPLDHMTINRFRSERIRPVFSSVFTQVVELLAGKGLITLDTYFLDGTKSRPMPTSTRSCGRRRPRDTATSCARRCVATSKRSTASTKKKIHLQHTYQLPKK